MKRTVLDRLVGFISPQAEIRRVKARATLEFYERSYDAAQTFKTDDWTSATKGSSNKEIEAALPILRDKARDAVRNNPYALRARDVIVGNTIGHGIVPNIKGKTPEQQATLRAAWKVWANSTLCDAEGKRDFYGLQASVMGAIVESGEVLSNKVLVKEPVLVANDKIKKAARFVNKIQILESDYVDSRKKGDKIVQGVEIDSLGRRTGIWVLELHPGDKQSQSRKIDAKSISLIFRPDRPGQQRGVSWYHAVIRRLEDLKNYQEATLIREKIAACYAVFLMQDDSSSVLSAAARKKKIEQDSLVEPGLIKRLNPGESVAFASPPTVDNSEYVSDTLREVAAGMGITYESFSNDYSRVNFSSGRLGKLEMNRNVDLWRWNMIVPQFCEPSFQWFLEWCDLALGIDVEGASAEWTPPAREFIDPATEIESIKKAIRTGIKTLPEAIREQGRDPEEFFEEVKKSNELMDKHGLAFDSDPRKLSAVGFAQAGDSFDKLLGNEPTQDKSSEKENN